MPSDTLLDRIRAWREDPKVAVAALVVLALVAGFVWYRVGLGAGGASEGATTDPAAGEVTPSTTGTTVPTSTAPAGDVTVHVAGAVDQPGVVELPSGSRVIDALEAVGGGVAEADLDRLNLAAPVADGERILVQKVGDPIAPAPPSGSSGGTGAASAGPVNVNTADLATLETLPGIGPVLAQAIIDEREERGGFRSVNELRDVRGIGDARFADLEGLVTV